MYVIVTNYKHSALSQLIRAMQRKPDKLFVRDCLIRKFFLRLPSKFSERLGMEMKKPVATCRESLRGQHEKTPDRSKERKPFSSFQKIASGNKT